MLYFGNMQIECYISIARRTCSRLSIALKRHKKKGEPHSVLLEIQTSKHQH
jgi:hypothetical protein